MGVKGWRTCAGVLAAIQMLAAGATFLRASRDRSETLRFINLYGATRIRTTPGTLGELMDAMDAANIACPSIERILLVGGLFDRTVLERVLQHFQAKIEVGYGATEVGRVSGGAVDPATYEPGYVGELVPEIKIVTTSTRADPAPLVVVRRVVQVVLGIFEEGPRRCLQLRQGFRV